MMGEMPVSFLLPHSLAPALLTHPIPTCPASSTDGSLDGTLPSPGFLTRAGRWLPENHELCSHHLGGLSRVTVTAASVQLGAWQAEISHPWRRRKQDSKGGTLPRKPSLKL
jgi:hypothetical protein